MFDNSVTSAKTRTNNYEAYLYRLFFIGCSNLHKHTITHHPAQPQTCVYKVLFAT